LGKGLQCYKQCRTELRHTVDQHDTSQVQITTRDALIDDLKKNKSELEKTLEDNESYCHQWGVHLPHTYRRVLERYGAKTRTFRVTDNIASYYTWMNDELKVLPHTMSKVGDYGATTSSEAIFQLLEVHGCDHFKAFGTHGFEFPSSGEMPAPSKTVDTITKIVLRKFWAESGREHMRKKAVDHLAKVLSLSPTLSLIVFISFKCIVFLMHFFLIDLFWPGEAGSGTPQTLGNSRCGRDSGALWTVTGLASKS
jgi:hypothetical protein